MSDQKFYDMLHENQKKTLGDELRETVEKATTGTGFSPLIDQWLSTLPPMLREAASQGCLSLDVEVPESLVKMMNRRSGPQIYDSPLYKFFDRKVDGWCNKNGCRRSGGSAGGNKVTIAIEWAAW